MLTLRGPLAALPLHLAVAVLLGGCTAEAPDVEVEPPSAADAGAVFADTIITFGDTDSQENCTTELPACDETASDCGPTEVLGAPDGVSYTLPESGRLEVAFRCSSITETGGEGVTPELEILSTVPEGSSAVVEVSFDGNTYSTLFNLDTSDQQFDLASGAPAEMTVIRFVRISDQGQGGIEIDAIGSI